MPTILALKLVGVILMGFMGLYPRLWTNLDVIIPVYVVRTAIINSAYPLQKSILMDYVPKAGCAVLACLSQPSFAFDVSVAIVVALVESLMRAALK